MRMRVHFRSSDNLMFHSKAITALGREVLCALLCALIVLTALSHGRMMAMMGSAKAFSHLSVLCVQENAHSAATSTPESPLKTSLHDCSDCLASSPSLLAPPLSLAQRLPTALSQTKYPAISIIDRRRVSLLPWSRGPPRFAS